MTEILNRRGALGRGVRLLLVGGAAAVAAFNATGSAQARAFACPTSNPPDTLVLAGGTPQTAKLHQAFAEMLQLMLVNSNACPVTTNEAGVSVTFTAPTSGATGTFAASGSNTIKVGTNASGQASAAGFTANGTAGSYTVTASSDYGSVSFSLTNSASGIAAMITGTPTNESATTGTRYAQPLQATVLDANGSPVENAAVTFTLGSVSGGGGASGGSTAAAGASFDGGSAQATETTNAAGVATSPLFTANSTAGAFTATAATAGIIEPVSFALDNLAGKPPTIIALAPAKQSATVGARYRKPLEVKLLDRTGKPLQGLTVAFSLGTNSGAGAGANGSGGGGAAGASFAGGSSQATAVTDADGIATSPRFSANVSAGRYTATATTTGTSEAATFSLDNLAGKAPTITASSDMKHSATVGSRYAKPLEVRVRDGSGTPLQGATVTFTLGASGGGGSGSASASGATFVGGSAQATETTNAAGIATSPHLEANTTAGSFTATATTAGTSNGASFLLHNLPGEPATITAGVAATESTGVGTRFPVRLAVTVSDKDSNPVAGMSVKFTAPARGAGGHFAGKKRTVTVKTDAKGVAIAPPFVANRTPGGYVVQASTARHSAAFALVNQPAA
jgi:protocatechuate 3,4-dioxygenase beta subunit